jgi:CRP-like cAMP-binding protein
MSDLTRPPGAPQAPWPPQHAGARPPGPAAGNRLLGALAIIAPADAAWLEAQLEPVTLESGAMLAPAGEVLDHVYFPDTCVVSYVSRMADGSAVEVGTVGHEGLVSVTLFLDGGRSQSDALVQIPGAARRAPAAEVVAGADERPDFRRFVHRYTQAYLTQVAQTAACNRLHHLEARCARWLLMTHDRVSQGERFPLTQEFLAVMLGVRRAGVSLAANALRDAGLIRYSRGAVRVLDRAGLEAAACECYRIVRREFDRLLP